MSDIIISGSSCSIPCWCSRFSVDNYTFICETWITKSQWNDLRNSVRPGATSELFQILGNPHFYDTSWQGYNTLVFSPIAGNLLAKLKRETVGFCRNIMMSPTYGDKGNIWVRIECVRSGSTSL